MKNIWTIVCKNSIVDKETNSLSLMETIDGITVKVDDKIDLGQVKILPLSFCIASLWFDEEDGNDRAFSQTVEILDPSGKKLKDFPQDCLMPAGKKKLRVFTKINGFGFTKPGLYTIVTKYKEGEGNYKKVFSNFIDLTFSKEDKG